MSVSFNRYNWGRALRVAANDEGNTGNRMALVRECGWLLNTNVDLDHVRAFAEKRIVELNELLIIDHNHIELAENDRVLQHIDHNALSIAVSLWDIHIHELYQHNHFLMLLEYATEN